MLTSYFIFNLILNLAKMTEPYLFIHQLVFEYYVKISSYFLYYFEFAHNLFRKLLYIS